LCVTIQCKPLDLIAKKTDIVDVKYSNLFECGACVLQGIISMTSNIGSMQAGSIDLGYKKKSNGS